MRWLRFGSAYQDGIRLLGAARTMSSYVLLYLLIVLVLSSSAARISPRDTSSRPQLRILPSGESVTAPVGRPFVLNCLGANGDARLFTELSWYNPRGELIVPGANQKIQVTRTNNNERLILAFLEPSPNDSGSYRCEGSFQNSERLSSQITLNVYEGVVFHDCPDVQALVKDQPDGHIKCTVTSQPKADVSWFGKGQELDTQRYTIESNGIRIRGTAAEADSGTYTIMATVMETGQLEQRTITVNVHSKPEITQLRHEFEAVEDNEARLSCRASGSPFVDYSWLDNRRRNLSEVQGFVVNRENGDLIIQKVSRDLDGVFTCIENAAGRVDRSTSLNIVTKPSVTSLESVSVVEGQPARLICRATGNPLPQLSMRREGDGQQPLETSPANRIRIEMREDSIESVLAVTFTDVRPSDDGLYYCQAENKGGKVERAGHLEVQFRPDLSQNLRVVKTWAGHAVNISCVANSIPNATITWYDNVGHEIRNDGTYMIFNGAGRSELQVNPRTGAHIYREYRCEAINKLGRAEHYVTLMEAFPPGPIDKAHVVQLTPFSVTFAFDGPSNDGGLPLTRYHVTYAEVTFGQPIGRYNHSWPAVRGTFTIDGLRPRTEYVFNFALENEAGLSPFSGDLYETTPAETFTETPPVIRDDHTKGSLSGDVMSIYSAHSSKSSLLSLLIISCITMPTYLNYLYISRS